MDLPHDLVRLHQVVQVNQDFQLHPEKNEYPVNSGELRKENVKYETQDTVHDLWEKNWFQ